MDSLKRSDTDEVASIDWLRTLGSGLLAGAAFVAVTMLVENRAIKLGSKLLSK